MTTTEGTSRGACAGAVTASCFRHGAIGSRRSPRYGRSAAMDQAAAHPARRRRGDDIRFHSLSPWRVRGHRLSLLDIDFDEALLMGDRRSSCVRDHLSPIEFIQVTSFGTGRADGRRETATVEGISGCRHSPS